MIHVIASIYIEQGKLPEILKIYESFTPQVNNEDGCIMYSPTVDQPTEIITQVQDSAIITVIEQWENLEAFNAHLNAPHVIEFRKNIKGIVEKVSIKVLKDALTAE